MGHFRSDSNFRSPADIGRLKTEGIINERERGKGKKCFSHRGHRLEVE